MDLSSQYEQFSDSRSRSKEQRLLPVAWPAVLGHPILRRLGSRISFPLPQFSRRLKWGELGLPQHGHKPFALSRGRFAMERSISKASWTRKAFWSACARFPESVSGQHNTWRCALLENQMRFPLAISD